MKKLSKLILSAILIFSICCVNMPIANATNSMPSSASRRVGCWWWHKSDGNNEILRETYLSCLEQAGVNEIYYYAYSDLIKQKFDDLHTFIQAAMKHGMRVAILFDDPNAALDPKFSQLTKLKKGFLAYKTEYPNDALYGLHFDVEPGHTLEALTAYCNNFVPKMTDLRKEGICCEVDVACGWANKGSSIKLKGIKGIYNIIAKNCDTMTLMSYRDTASKILSFGDNAYKACLKYGCDVIFGVETDNSSEGNYVNFFDETTEYLMNEMDTVFKILEERNPPVNYGMAIHHARSLYMLYQK